MTIKIPKWLLAAMLATGITASGTVTITGAGHNIPASRSTDNCQIQA